MTSRKQPTGEKRTDFNCVPKLKFLDDKPRKVYFDYLYVSLLYIAIVISVKSFI